MNDTNDPQQKSSQFSNIPAEIKSFLEALLADAGITTIDDETRDEMVKELYVRLDHYLTNTIIENMPRENIEEFIKMNETKKSMEEMQKFLMDKMPNAQGVFVKAFDDFRNMYLANVNASRDKEAIINQQKDATQNDNKVN